jgi:hypothetical protein
MSTTTRNDRPAPLQVLSALTLVVADPLIFAFNVMSVGEHVPSIVLAGSALSALVVLLAERHWGDERWGSAAVKALITGVAVAAPLPVLGTFFGIAALVWTGLQQRSRSLSARLRS